MARSEQDPRQERNSVQVQQRRSWTKRRRNRRERGLEAGATLVAAAGAADRGAEAVGSAVVHNLRADAANAELVQGAASINRLGRQWAKVGEAQLGGRVAEEVHAATFSADAVMKGRPELHAHTTASQGRGLDPADIELTRFGRVVGRAQSKYRGTPDAAAADLSAPRYDGMQKVAPAGQVEAVRKAAQRRALRNRATRPETSARYADTELRADDRVRFDGVESRPLSNKEARALARLARKGSASLEPVAKRSVGRQVAAATGKAAAAGAAGAALGALAIGGVTNAVAVVRGKKATGQAVMDTAVSTGTAALEGAAKAGAGALLKSGCEVLAKGAVRQGGKSILQTAARSNGVLAVGSVVVDTAVSGARLAKGQISGKEFGLRVGESASSAGGAWGGAAAGAALGSFVPGAGTLIGGILGGLLGGLGGAAVFRRVLR